MEKKEVKFIFSEEGAFFSINELVDYLQLLKASYAFALQNPRINEFSRTNSDRENEILVIESYENLISGLEPTKRQLLNRYNKDLKENELDIIFIRKQSPLEVVFNAVPIALMAAAIFSGGKFTGNIRTGDFSFDISSLGKGLKDFQEALSKRDERKRIDFEERIRIDQATSKIFITEEKREDRLLQEIKQLQEAQLVSGLDKKTYNDLQEEIEKRLKKVNKKRK